MHVASPNRILTTSFLSHTLPISSIITCLQKYCILANCQQVPWFSNYNENGMSDKAFVRTTYINQFYRITTTHVHRSIDRHIKWFSYVKKPCCLNRNMSLTMHRMYVHVHQLPHCQVLLSFPGQLLQQHSWQLLYEAEYTQSFCHLCSIPKEYTYLPHEDSYPGAWENQDKDQFLCVILI